MTIQKLPNFVIAHAEQMAKICILHFRSSYLVQINVAESEIFTVGHMHLTSHVESCLTLKDAQHDL